LLKSEGRQRKKEVTEKDARLTLTSCSGGVGGDIEAEGRRSQDKSTLGRMARRRKKRQPMESGKNGALKSAYDKGAHPEGKLKRKKVSSGRSIYVRNRDSFG